MFSFHTKDKFSDQKFTRKRKEFTRMSNLTSSKLIEFLNFLLNTLSFLKC